MSAPKTWQGKPNKKTRQNQKTLFDQPSVKDRLNDCIEEAVRAAWDSLKAKQTVEEVLSCEQQSEAFYRECERLGIPGSRTFCAEKLAELVVTKKRTKRTPTKSK